MFQISLAVYSISFHLLENFIFVKQCVKRRSPSRHHDKENLREMHTNQHKTNVPNFLTVYPVPRCTAHAQTVKLSSSITKENRQLFFKFIHTILSDSVKSKAPILGGTNHGVAVDSVWENEID
ncbi:hypothetical protein CEXT_496331 [Caerostris extrusa]|uniref:Uncharacterized protein n=1 Tax=Caerostris extrusa TaxID=172846 RepID=A0AAV4VJE3_CAEEX|nr:hypothetical protein CEXT_496331 [Caerostris extrusa]